MAELRYYADDRDRRHGSATRIVLDTVGEAVRAADRLRPPATVADIRYDDGTIVPDAYRELADRTIDTDAVIHHQWSAHGTDGWRQAVATSDGSDLFDLSVVNRRARFTGPAAAASNQRAFWLRDGTRWPDSEICSLWWGPSVFTAAGAPVTNRPQLGHVHGAHVGEDGRIRAVVAWSNIFGGPNPEAILLNLWEATGTTTLGLGSGGSGGSLDNVNRGALVLHANRFAFGATFTDLRVQPHWAADGVAVSGTGTLSGMAVTGLNGTFTVQSGVDHQGLIRLFSSGAPVTDPTAGGTWAPDYPGKVFPYWVRSRWVPPVMWLKQWPYGIPEPDDGSPYVWSATVATDADTIEVPTGIGAAGVLAAHAHSGSYLEYGNVTISRAGAQQPVAA